MTAALSPVEMRMVEEYDATTEKQIEDGKPVTRKSASLSDLYRAFEAADLDGIKELHLDIGVMKGILEDVVNDDPIRQWLEYFIRVEINMIDNLTQEVIYDREQAEKFNRLPG